MIPKLNSNIMICLAASLILDSVLPEELNTETSDISESANITAQMPLSPLIFFSKLVIFLQILYKFFELITPVFIIGK
ncbi:MAG: hypothetical protein BWY70_01826 [Bacteroidetes bacterium ADurb.Bin408]|nr:MAG: hypothetical protein BWY70_01826 [Bacteroidetes bacterium ADurb.Bin408]